MHVNCTHCNALCQIADSLLGHKVKCGKCSQVFTAEAPPAESPAPPTAATETPPADSASAAPGAAAGAAQMAQAAKEQISTAGKAIGKKLGGWFGGVKNMFQKGEEGQTTGGAPDTTEVPAGEFGDGDDVGFDFDADGAGDFGAEEEQSDEPVLGVDPQAVHGQYRLDIGSCTSTGKVRERNEDSYLLQHHVWSNLEARHEMAFIVVSDGMGGHEAGDRASKMTLHHIGASLAPVLGMFYKRDGNFNRPPSFKAPIEAAVKTANKGVHEYAKSEAGKEGMGATVDAVLIWDEQVDIVHVGDCRVYHYHEGILKQITKDQTLVERMVDQGQLTRAEADDNPAGNQVLQGIGIRDDVDPTHYAIKLVPGDWLICACDGLYAHVKRDMLAEHMQGAPSSAAQMAHFLVDLANHLGGSDNCTVVAVRCY